MTLIDSMLGTAKLNCFKYLVNIINENMSNKYMINSNTSCIDQLNAFSFIFLVFMLAMMSNHCSQTFFCNKQLKKSVHMFAKKTFQQDIQLIYFNLVANCNWSICLIGKLHCKIYGVRIGISLGPALAIFFVLAQLERQLINTNFEFLHVQCSKFVDDISVYMIVSKILHFFQFSTIIYNLIVVHTIMTFNLKI